MAYYFYNNIITWQTPFVNEESCNILSKAGDFLQPVFCSVLQDQHIYMLPHEILHRAVRLLIFAKSVNTAVTDNQYRKKDMQ